MNKRIQKKIEKVVTERYPDIKTLETRMVVALDYHELGIWSVRYLVAEIYELARTGKRLKAPWDYEFGKGVQERIEQGIQEVEPSIETLDKRWSDSLDFYELPIWTWKEIFNKVYQLGLEAK